MKKYILTSLFFTTSFLLYAQGAHDFKITEVFISQPGEQNGLKDEYGESCCWIEIENTSYSTHDIRSCFLTINEDVLNDTLSAPDREKLMWCIPSGDERTKLEGQQRITFFADGNTNRGTLHTNFKLEAKRGDSIFIALYDGNAVDLLDSVRVPTNLQKGCSWALLNGKWQQQKPNKVTPNAPNSIGGNSNKIKDWKEKDPYGIAMTIISMGIVFGCLLLLFVFFYIFGWIINKMNRASQYKAIMKIREQANKVVVIAKEGIETRGIEMENYVAAITLALHEHLGNMHDIESGIITIQHHATEWESKDHTLRHTPEVHINNQIH